MIKLNPGFEDESESNKGFTGRPQMYPFETSASVSTTYKREIGLKTDLDRHTVLIDRSNIHVHVVRYVCDEVLIWVIGDYDLE